MAGNSSTTTFTKIKDKNKRSELVDVLVWFPHRSSVHSVSIISSASKNEVLARIRELNPTEEVIEVSFAGVVPDTTDLWVY